MRSSSVRWKRLSMIDEDEDPAMDGGGEGGGSDDCHRDGEEKLNSNWCCCCWSRILELFGLAQSQRPM